MVCAYHLFFREKKWAGQLHLICVKGIEQPPPGSLFNDLQIIWYEPIYFGIALVK